MATAIAPPSSAPISALLSVRAATASSRTKQNMNKNKNKKQRALGNFSHMAHVVRKDMEFLNRGIDNGVAWANEVFRIPQIAKKINDLVWLCNLEDPLAPPLSPPSWPQPWYPGRIKNDSFAFGVCVFMPDSM